MKTMISPIFLSGVLLIIGSPWTAAAQRITLISDMSAKAICEKKMEVLTAPDVSEAVCVVAGLEVAESFSNSPGTAAEVCSKFTASCPIRLTRLERACSKRPNRRVGRKCHLPQSSLDRCLSKAGGSIIQLGSDLSCDDIGSARAATVGESMEAVLPGIPACRLIRNRCPSFFEAALVDDNLD